VRGKTMCRNIRPLFNYDPPATRDEIQAASVQFVRKISGYKKPSQSNVQALEEAVEEITKISEKLLSSLVTTSPPRNRELELIKAREKAREKFKS
jgi:hypothetical protein